MKCEHCIYYNEKLGCGNDEKTCTQFVAIFRCNKRQCNGCGLCERLDPDKTGKENDKKIWGWF